MHKRTIERRQKERLPLHFPVEVFAPGGVGDREATTVNMSSRGLYWRSQSPFSRGERVQCHIEIIPRCSETGADAVYLDCLLEVVRVDRYQGEYGAACRIIRHLFRRQNCRTWASQAPGEAYMTA